MGTAMITIRPFLLSDIPAAAELEGLNQPHPWSEDVFNDELVDYELPEERITEAMAKVPVVAE